MSLNIPVRALLAKTDRIVAQSTMTWESVQQIMGRFDEKELEREAKLRAASHISHNIVGDLLNGGDWKARREVAGIVHRLEGYWMSHDQMLNLLQEAYDLGRTHSPRIISPGEFKP